MSAIDDKKFLHYRPERSWGKVIFSQASVILFTGGSASVHAGIPHPPAQRPTPGKADPLPAQSMLGDTVNKRAVCILLECNSCSQLFSIKWSCHKNDLITLTNIYQTTTYVEGSFRSLSKLFGGGKGIF